jgi:hypothetical protein
MNDLGGGGPAIANLLDSNTSPGVRGGYDLLTI